jgi:hypothetical protein
VPLATESLKTAREQASVVVGTHPRPGADEGGGCDLACAACRAGITTTAARIDISGSHEHHFTNPDGYRFHIGCFSRAPGCKGNGAFTAEFTWFLGYSWQLESCGRCGAFLGWRYRSAEHRFHGLILTRLVELEPSDTTSS